MKKEQIILVIRIPLKSSILNLNTSLPFSFQILMSNIIHKGFTWAHHTYMSHLGLSSSRKLIKYARTRD